MPDILKAGQALEKQESIISKNKKFLLRMQEDGNLVLYKKEKEKETALWSTNTNGKEAAIAKMQEDGNFVLYDENRNVYWNSNTQGNSYQPYIQVQNDGNLVIYSTVAHWNTGTGGK
jgi:roadblock/LC7 domain-containing protein